MSDQLPLARAERVTVLADGADLIFVIEGLTSGYGGTFVVTRQVRNEPIPAHFTLNELPGNPGINPTASPTDVPTIRALRVPGAASGMVVTATGRKGVTEHAVTSVHPNPEL